MPSLQSAPRTSFTFRDVVTSRFFGSQTSHLLEGDLLRAVPERETSELEQVLAALDDRREVVAGVRARLRAEGAVAVREEELGLGDAAGEEEQLARRGVAGCVLGA